VNKQNLNFCKNRNFGKFSFGRRFPIPKPNPKPISKNYNVLSEAAFTNEAKALENLGW
jgi:hypothetical protein